MTAFPCSVCGKEVYDWHKAITCDTCEKWVHIKCNKLDKKDHKYHEDNPDAPFNCIKCMENHVPFSKLDNNQFNISVKQGVNYLIETDVNYLPSERNQRLFDKINKAIFNNTHNIDADEEDNDIETNTNCKYYGVEEFTTAKFNSDKTFSVLHLNIHSIQLHIAELRIILEMLNFKFDFICISESKIKEGSEPRTDIKIDGYQPPLEHLQKPKRVEN